MKNLGWFLSTRLKATTFQSIPLCYFLLFTDRSWNEPVEVINNKTPNIHSLFPTSTPGPMCIFTKPTFFPFHLTLSVVPAWKWTVGCPFDVRKISELKTWLVSENTALLSSAVMSENRQNNFICVQFSVTNVHLMRLSHASDININK